MDFSHPLWIVYYWITFGVSLICLLRLPSKLDGMDNFGGSTLCAMFGFVFWPLFIAAELKRHVAPGAQDGQKSEGV
jgi:hypothetical protein